LTKGKGTNKKGGTTGLSCRLLRKWVFAALGYKEETYMGGLEIGEGPVKKT